VNGAFLPDLRFSALFLGKRPPPRRFILGAGEPILGAGEPILGAGEPILGAGEPILGAGVKGGPQGLRSGAGTARCGFRWRRTLPVSCSCPVC
jgi:hypothetical protein